MIKYPTRFETEKGTKEIKTFAPKTASQTEEIIEYIKFAPCIVTLANSKINHSQRIIDILLGASVVLGVKICVLDDDNYLFTKE